RERVAHREHRLGRGRGAQLHDSADAAHGCPFWPPPVCKWLRARIERIAPVDERHSDRAPRRRWYGQRVPEPIWTRAVFPLTERRFTHDAYARFLDALAGCAVMPLRELAAGTNGVGRPVVGLRHDVDLDLDSALA